MKEIPHYRLRNRKLKFYHSKRIQLCNIKQNFLTKVCYTEISIHFRVTMKTVIHTISNRSFLKLVDPGRVEFCEKS